MSGRDYNYIWNKWIKAYENVDYLEIDNEDLETLLKAKAFLHKNAAHVDAWQEFKKYIDKRNMTNKLNNINQKKKGIRRLLIWVIAVVIIPAFFISWQLHSKDRPYLNIAYSYLRVLGHHKEINSNGKLYDDITRKDIMVYLIIKNTGTSPANNLHIKRYLSYEGLENPAPIGDTQRLPMISPDIPIMVRQSFMILNEHLNNFVLVTIMSYYKQKFWGLFYIGRPHEHYCRVRWNGKEFIIEESEDLK